MLFYSMSYLYNMAPDYMSLKPTSVTQELCVFGQVTNLSVPQFPHLWDTRKTLYLMELPKDEELC